MNSVSSIVSEDAARRRRRCKRINAADRWHCGEYNPLMRLQIRSAVACPRWRPRAMVVIGLSGEAMKGLPLFVSCP
jgi:hypothetical protein